MVANRTSGSLNTALGALFETAAGKRASWFSLPGGARLFGAGDPADTLYLLKSGRLGVFRKPEGQESEFLGVVLPGEPVGEMSLLAGTPHTANVVALRDSEVMALPREAFFEAAHAHPEVMTELARLMILRARDTREQVVSAPTVFGVMGLSVAPVRPFAEEIAAEIRASGATVQVIDSSALKSAAGWFARVEESCDYVIYVSERPELPWSHLVARQVDRIFLVGRAEEEPPTTDQVWQIDQLDDHRMVDLVLLWKAGTANPNGSARWIDAIDPARWFNMRDGDRRSAAHLARVMTGTSVGLVLSGGGARAYAHVGAVRALVQAGVPVDFAGGASMGAIVAASLAMGWSLEEIDARLRKAFVETSPLDDIAFPILAMTGGRKVDERLAEHFGETLIEDLWTPYFCVSSNLTLGAVHVHRRGKLRKALRASIALPGILPPVVETGNVLVDGAVLRSFPTDVMRAWHLGTVVGVDVTRARGVDPAVIEGPPSWTNWLLSGDWRRGPPIVSVLMRAATITSAAEIALARAATDLLIIPKPEGVEIRDWKAYEPAVDAGYEATKAALAKLSGPVSELRKRNIALRPDEPVVSFDAPLRRVGGKEKGSSRLAVAGKRLKAAADKRRERRRAQRQTQGPAETA